MVANPILGKKIGIIVNYCLEGLEVIMLHLNLGIMEILEIQGILDVKRILAENLF